MSDGADNPYAPPVDHGTADPDPFNGPGQRAFYLPHRGGLVFTLGLVGLVLTTACGLGLLSGLPAWILGARDLSRMQAGALDPSGHGITRAGKICGMVATILSLIIVGFALIGMITSAPGGG